MIVNVERSESCTGRDYRVRDWVIKGDNELRKQRALRNASVWRGQLTDRYSFLLINLPVSFVKLRIKKVLVINKKITTLTAHKLVRWYDIAKNLILLDVIHFQ